MYKKERMKVCHVTSVHRTEDPRIFHKQCVSLAKEDYDVFLVSHGESYTKNGVNIIGVGKKPATRYQRFIESGKKVYEVAKEIDADIYHLHDPELLPYALKLKKRGAKVIFDSHEDYMSTLTQKKYIPNWAKPIVTKVFKSYEKHVIKNIDGAVTCYHWTQARYSELNKNTKMILNYPIVDNDKLEPHNSDSRKISFAGGIWDQWQHHNIIKAIENIDNVGYELAGKFLDGYEEQLAHLKGWSKVNYHGMLPFEEVKQVYLDSAIGMCLLDYIAQTKGNVGNLSNTKFFEIMQMGLPIICTDFILWKEIIDEEKCGIYVNPNNVDEIEEAINYLLDNPKEALAMGVNGHKAILKKYNWAIEEKKLFELYETL